MLESKPIAGLPDLHPIRLPAAPYCLNCSITTYSVKTGGDGSGSLGFNAGTIHFGEGVSDFGDLVKPEGCFEVILGRHPLLTLYFSPCLVLYVGPPRIIRIAIGGIVGEGDLTGVIRGVVTCRRGMSFCRGSGTAVIPLRYL